MTVLSIGMIVKNEEKRLRRTLEALQPLRDAIDCELIIADTGSDDGTIEIAKQFADVFLEIAWENDFAKARNATLRKARGAWFFYLDADEVLREPGELIDFLQSRKQKDYELISFDIRNCISEDEDRWSTFSGERIFRRHSDEWFEGALHEECRKHDPVRILHKTHLAHYGYNNDDTLLMHTKAQRNLRIIERMIDEAGEDATGHKVAKLYLDYVDSLTLEKNHEREGIAAADKGIALLLPLPVEWVTRVAMLARGYGQKLGLLANLGALDECVSATKDYFEQQTYRGQWDIDVCFYAGWAYWHLKEPQKAQEYLEKYFTYLAMEQPQDISRLVAFKSPAMPNHARLVLCETYRVLGEKDKLWECVSAITLPKVDGVDVLGYQWQIALDDKTSERLPQLYAQLPNERREEILAGLTDAICRKDSARQADIAAGLRKITDEHAELLPHLALATNEAEELRETLGRLNGQKFTPAQGGIIRQCLHLQVPMAELLPHLEKNIIDAHIITCADYYNDWANWLASYYDAFEVEDLNLPELWLARELLCTAIIDEKVDLNLRLVLLPMAIRYVGEYLPQVYQPIMLNEQIDLLPAAGQFVIYVRRAEEAVQKQDYAIAVQSLREALRAYPETQAVIEKKLAEIEELADPIGAEMERLTTTVKAQIRTLIANDYLNEARTLIDELSDIVPDDSDIPILLQQAQEADMIWN